MSDIKKILTKAFSSFIDKKVLEKIFIMMDYNNNGAVTQQQFLAVMKP